MLRAILAVVLCAGWLAPGLGQAQGLGDAAKREKARRAEAKVPARVYDNEAILDDGPPSKGTFSAPSASDAPGPVTESGGVPFAAGLGESESSRPEPAPAGGGESYWRGRAGSARAAVAAAEKRLADLEAKESRYARQSLAAARRAVDDLEEEARKAGALPGWLR